MATCQNDKLITAQSSAQVTDRAELAEPVGNLADKLVTTLMPVSIIYVFEAIEIYKQHGKRHIALNCKGNCFFEALR